MSAIDLQQLSSAIRSLAGYDGESAEGVNDCRSLIGSQMFAKGHIAYAIYQGQERLFGTSLL